MAGPHIPQKYLDIADKSFAKKGVYRTAFALKLALRGDAAFKKEYEAYVLSKNKKAPTLSRWFQEEWVQVAPFLHDGTIIACGAERTHENDHKGKACRPLIRIAASTPQTLHELVKECGKEAVLKEAHKKETNPDYRIAWHLLTKDGIVEKPVAKKAAAELTAPKAVDTAAKKATYAAALNASQVAKKETPAVSAIKSITHTTKSSTNPIPPVVVSNPVTQAKNFSENRSGLGDGTNPGKGSGTNNSPNVGTLNPSASHYTTADARLLSMLRT